MDILKNKRARIPLVISLVSLILISLIGGYLVMAYQEGDQTQFYDNTTLTITGVDNNIWWRDLDINDNISAGTNLILPHFIDGEQDFVRVAKVQYTNGTIIAEGNFIPSSSTYNYVSHYNLTDFNFTLPQNLLDTDELRIGFAKVFNTTTDLDSKLFTVNISEMPDNITMVINGLNHTGSTFAGTASCSGNCGLCSIVSGCNNVGGRCDASWSASSPAYLVSGMSGSCTSDEFSAPCDTVTDGSFSLGGSVGSWTASCTQSLVVTSYDVGGAGWNSVSDGYSSSYTHWLFKNLRIYNGTSEQDNILFNQSGDDLSRWYLDRQNNMTGNLVSNWSVGENIFNVTTEQRGNLYVYFDLQDEKPYWDIIPAQAGTEDVQGEVNLSLYTNDLKTGLGNFKYDYFFNDTSKINSIIIDNSTGNLSWIPSANQYGDINISIIVYDESSLSAQTEFNLHINEVDDVGSLTGETATPETGTEFYNNVSIYLNITATEIEGIDTIWLWLNYTNGDYENITNTSNGGFVNDGDVWSFYYDDGNFSNQDNKTYQWYMNDSFGRETTISENSIFIENRNATVKSGSVAITPDPAFNTDTLNCTIGDYWDYDLDEIGFLIEWYNVSDGNILSGVSNTEFNLSSGNFSDLNQIKCKVIPYDFVENGTYVESQVIEIGSSNVAPLILQTNATSGNTNIISDSTNPTNNDSFVHFEVGISDSIDAVDDGFRAYFCKTDSFSFPETCNTGEWAKNESNLSSTLLNAEFTITSSETLDSYNFYVFITDNQTVSSSLSGSFDVNHPPENRSLTYPINYEKININSVILNGTSSDINLDTITYYFYINQSEEFELNGTSTSGILNISNYPDTFNYSWFVERIDEHSYSIGNSSIEYFQVDYTSPNNTISAQDYENTVTGQTARISMNQTDNTGLDSCYLKFISSAGTPNFYTKTDCNTDIYLDETNLTESAPRSYDIRVLTNDTFGNENESEVSFTATKYSSAVIQPTGEGGGGAEEIVCNEADIKWTIRPRRFNTLLGKDSYAERTIEIINNGTKDIEFEIRCLDTAFNFTKNSCQFVNYTKEIKVEPNIEQIYLYELIITTPEEAEFGDEFSFGLFFTDGETCSGTVSFVNKVSRAGSFRKILQSKEVNGKSLPLIIPTFIIFSVVLFLGIAGRKVAFFILPLSILFAFVFSGVFLIYI